MQMALPVGIAHQSSAWRPELLLLRREEPSHDRLNAHDRKEFFGNNGHTDSVGLITRGNWNFIGTHFRHALKPVNLATHILEIRISKAHLAALGIHFPDPHNLVG